jgi:hypothetical protein
MIILSDLSQDLQNPNIITFMQITLCVYRFIMCTGYVSYGVLLRIPLHSVIADIRNKGQPVPPTGITIITCC